MGKVSSEEVRRALLQFVDRHMSVCFVAEVTAVEDAEQGLIEVKYNELTFEVKLRAVSGSTEEGELRIPTLGSRVFCVSEGNSNNSFVVVADTGMDEYRLGFEDITCIMNKEGVVFNGGDLGGMIKIKKLTEKLNGLKDTVNDLIGNFNSHIHITTATVGMGGPGTIAATTTKADPAVVFKRGDYENEEVKH